MRLPMVNKSAAAKTFTACRQALANAPRIARAAGGQIWKPAAVILLLGASASGFSFFAKNTASLVPPPTQAPAIKPLAKKDVPPPELRAQSVFVERLSTGEVLLTRNADERLPIASLTKLVTAYVIAEKLPPLEFVTLEYDAKTVGDADDKRSAVAAGESIKSEDILKFILISSDNDAAYAGASHIGGLDASAGSFKDRIQNFVALMNKTARKLKLANTRFANPAGTDDPENYSSARDMATIAKEITRLHPELWLVSRNREAFVFGKSGERYSLVNTDILLEEYPAIYGTKTGFEDLAQGALLLVYHLSGREPVVMVILKSPERFADGRALINWLEENFVIQ